MQSDERDFFNIDLSRGKPSNDFGEQAKKEKFLRDLERLRKIQDETRRKVEKKQRAAGEGIEKGNGGNQTESRARYCTPEGSDHLHSDVHPGKRSPHKTVRAEKEVQRRKRKKRFLPRLFTCVMVFLLLWGVKSLYFSGDTHQNGYYTVAVFGVDSRDGALGAEALSDVNMLVSLNKQTGDIKICSIYRDTFVQISPEGKRHKFNEAYFKGGPEQALWTIKYNLDIEPDDFITFNWKAVIDSINIMDGIDLEITKEEFRYINSFITETVKSTGIGSVQLKHAGMNHLDGVQAVAYARLRLMDSDFKRTERQRKVVSLLMDKIRAADTKKRLELVNSVLPETKTSIGINDLLIYAKGIKHYHLTESVGFPFDKDTVWIERKDCVIPITMESNVVRLHQFLYDNADYRASNSVKNISDYIVKKTGRK